MRNSSLPPISRVIAIVVRHGSTGLNDPRNPKLRAWEDVPITDEGRAQIQLTANKLKIYSPKIVYSSDLSRDSESAFLMAEILGNIPYETDFNLRTSDMGTLSGKPEQEILSVVRHWYQDPSWRAPSGESLNNFARRLWQFWEPKTELAREVPAFRPSIFLTHGRIPAYMDSYYNRKPYDEGMMPFPGGYAVLRSNPSGMDTFEIVTEREPILADV